MRAASWSLVPVAKWGLRSVGACHQRILSGPPPPRLVGVKTGFFAWARATPAEASICAARGAVSPRPTIVCTKPRRLTRPCRTSSINSRSFRSSIQGLPRLERSDEASPAARVDASPRQCVTLVGTRAQHPDRHVDGLEHTFGVGDALPRAIERRTVVDGHPQEGQAHGHVDAGKPRPLTTRFVVGETERLDGHVALIVVHGDDDVELAASRPREKRVGREGAVDVEPFSTCRLHSRDDLRLLLVAEEPVLSSMRIEAAHGDAGPGYAQPLHGLLREPDDAQHAVLGAEIGHAPEGYVGRHVDDLELSAHEEHG